jgi:hypothetical protein
VDALLREAIAMQSEPAVSRRSEGPDYFCWRARVAAERNIQSIWMIERERHGEYTEVAARVSLFSPLYGEIPAAKATS